jgi:hypothetical protein
MKPKITVAAPFAVHAQADGRAAKLLALCARWSRVAGIEIVYVDASITHSERTPIAPDVVAVRVAGTGALAARAVELFAPCGPNGAFFSLTVGELPAYRAALTESCRTAALAVACTPFTYAELRAVARAPVFIAAQAVESIAADDTFGDDARGREVRRFIAGIERTAVSEADGVIAACDADREHFIGLGCAPERTSIGLPLNWDDSDACPSRERRLQAKARSNLAGRTVVLFTGSNTRGNAASVTGLIAAAERCPDAYLLVAGSIVETFRQTRAPANVGFTGVLAPDQLRDALLLADLCIEPGAPSGLISTKLQGYVRAGAPVLALPQTALTAGLSGGSYAAIDPHDSLAAAIVDALREGERGDIARVAAFAALRARHARAAQTDIVRDALGSAAPVVAHF